MLVVRARGGGGGGFGGERGALSLKGGKRGIKRGGGP